MVSPELSPTSGPKERATPTPRPQQASQAPNPVVSPDAIVSNVPQYPHDIPSGFGDRLHQARDHAPAHSAPAEALAMVRMPDDHLYIPRHNLTSRGYLKEPGSYASLYDYANHKAFGRAHPPVYTLPFTNVSSVFPGLGVTQPFEASPGPGHSLAFGGHPSAQVPPARSPPRIVVDDAAPSGEVQVAPDAQQRTILVAPLRIIRSQSVRSPFLAPICEWIDRVLPAHNETIVESDQFIPSIAYKVSYPMTDEEWTNYQKVLTVFKLAGSVDAMLAVGSEAFDEWNDQTGMAPLFTEGQELDDLLSKLVEDNNLGKSWDVAKPWNEPGQTFWKAPQ